MPIRGHARIAHHFGCDGQSRDSILIAQGNLAISHEKTGRLESALQMKRDVYSRRLKLNGEEHLETLRAANNYGVSLVDLGRFEEAKALLRKALPVARRVLGESHETMLRMKWTYAEALYKNDGATLDELREAVTTLEDVERTAQRVFGGAHPIVMGVEDDLQDARAALRARETPPSASVGA